MPRYFVLAVILGMCFENPIAAVDTDAGMVNLQYLRLHDLEGVQDIDPWAIRSALEGAYREPVSFEWAFVQEDRTTEEEPVVRFAFEPSRPLGESLDALIATSDGRLTWRDVAGSVVVCPAEVHEGLENNMDVRISLHLTAASTWDALMEAAVQANKASPNDRPLEVAPGFLGRGYRAPDGFADERTITLSLEAVTVREAVCAIFAQSPLIMSYGYRNYFYPATGKPFSKLTIRCLDYKDRSKRHQQSGREMMTKQEIQRWNAEVENVVGAAESKD